MVVVSRLISFPAVLKSHGSRLQKYVEQGVVGLKLAASVFSFNNTKQTWKSPLIAIFGSMCSPSGCLQSRQNCRTLSKIIALGY